jgi:hypothetical protein
MQSHRCVFALKVRENLLVHHRIFDAGDDLDVATAALAYLDVDGENALQSLRPGHGCPAFSERSVFGRICRTDLVALTAFGRHHSRTMRAVGGENAVTNSPGVNLDARGAPAGGAPRMARIQSCQVDSRLRHQRDESRDEVHRLEDDMRGTIAVRAF